MGAQLVKEISFREGKYPFNFYLGKRGVYVFLRIGDHNLRLFNYGAGWKLRHEVAPFPWFALFDGATGTQHGPPYFATGARCMFRR